MTNVTRKAAVLGHPIAHSLSPVLHNAAYTTLGLGDWEYGRHDVDEAGLPAFLRELDDSWAGLSLTMPLKQAVIPLLDHVEPLAQVTGAVNTVVFSGKGAGRMTVGTNTDVHGIVAALREGAVGGAAVEGVGGERLSGVYRAAVIGAGATAASTLAALAELGCANPIVFVRNLGKTAPLRAAAQRMGVQPEFASLTEASSALVGFDAVVSTLPPHAADQLAQELLGAGTAPLGVLLDVAYDPAPTVLIDAWRTLAGSDVAAVTGERMLLHQAAEQVRLMTGLAGPIGAMSAALNDALAH